jgi:hypothetical protein
VAHDVGVEDGAAVGDALERVDEGGNVEDPILEEVAEPSGLALGKGRGDEDSLVNHTSAVLLTIGFLGVVVFAVVELVARARNRG